jgi:sulfatase-like protein
VKRGLPLYPVLLAIAMVLSIVLPSGASPYAGIRLLVGFALGALFVGAAARLLLGDRDRAGAAATMVVLFAFKGMDWRYAVLLLFAIGLIVAERLAATRRPSRVPWALAGRGLNAVSVVVLIAVVLRSAGDGSLGPYLAAIRTEGPTALRDSQPAVEAATGAPDVFVIVLDGHARADKLDAIFGYDDAPFLDGLGARGFEVASASRSNYLLTSQSLPSLLNMSHIADLVDREAAATSSRPYTYLIRPFASDSSVFRLYRSLGYEVIAISSGFEEVALRGADRFIDTGQVNELETRVLGNTAIAPGIQMIDADWFAAQQRARVVAVLDAAAEVARESHARPRLVVAHVPSPHAPIVFAADGSAVSMTDLANFFDDTFVHRALPREQALAGYAGQLAHVDQLALAAIDDVLAGASAPPIILVLSDHGSAAGVSWDDLNDSDLDERTANLFAAMTPGRSGVFPPDVTLVNVFGLLTESYFGRSYDPLPNTAYRWGDSTFPDVPIALPTATTP